jgi:hypothetical protein
VFAEGVVFYNLKRKAEGHTYMAKLRRDMYDWFYDGGRDPGLPQEGPGRVRGPGEVRLRRGCCVVSEMAAVVYFAAEVNCAGVMPACLMMARSVPLSSSR